MHPQANLPQSAAQRQAAAQQKKEVPEEFSAYQKYQEVSSHGLYNSSSILLSASIDFETEGSIYDLT